MDFEALAAQAMKASGVKDQRIAAYALAEETTKVKNRSQIAARGGIGALLRLLAHSADRDVTRFAAWGLGCLSADPSGAADMIEKNAASALLNFSAKKDVDLAARHYCMWALSNLIGAGMAVDNSATLDEFRRTGGLMSLVSILETTHVLLGRYIARMAATIAAADDGMRTSLVDKGGAVPLLLALALCKHAPTQAQAARALRVLAAYADIRPLLLEEGVVDAGIMLAGIPDADTQADTAHLFAGLTASVSMRGEVGTRAMGTLVGLALHDSAVVAEPAVVALANLMEQPDLHARFQADHGVNMLAAVLTSGTPTAQLHALRAASHLAGNRAMHPQLLKKVGFPRLLAGFAATDVLSHQFAAVAVANVAADANNHDTVLASPDCLPTVAAYAARADEEEVEAALVGPSGRPVPSPRILARRYCCMVLANTSANRGMHAALMEAGALLALNACAGLPDNVGRRNVAAAFANLACHRDNHPVMLTVGCVSALVSLCLNLSPDVHRYAAAALRGLATDTAAKATIVSEGGLDALILLLRTSTDTRVLREAVGCVCNLSLNDENKYGLLRAGAVAPLLHLCQHEASDVAFQSAATLANIAQLPEAQELIAGTRVEAPFEVVTQGRGGGGSGNADAPADVPVFVRGGRKRRKAAGAGAGAGGGKADGAENDEEDAVDDADGSDGMTVMCATMRHPSLEVQREAGRLMANVCACEAVHALVVERGADALLVSFVLAPDPMSQQIGALGVLNLSLNPAMRPILLAHGAVEPLASVLRSSDVNAESTQFAILAIANIGTDPSTHMALLDLGMVSLLVSLSRNPDDTVRQYAAYSLVRIGNSAGVRKRLSEEGGLDPILYLARSNDPDISLEVLPALTQLSFVDMNKPRVVLEGGLAPIHLLLLHPDVAVQRQAAAALANCAEPLETHEELLRSGILPKLAQLLLTADDVAVLREASRACSNLTREDAYGAVELLTALGVMPRLAAILWTDDLACRRMAAAALANLTVEHAGRQEGLRIGLLSTITRMLNMVADPGSGFANDADATRYALLVVANLCAEPAGAQEAAALLTSLMLQFAVSADQGTRSHAVCALGNLSNDASLPLADDELQQMVAAGTAFAFPGSINAQMQALAILRGLALRAHLRPTLLAAGAVEPLSLAVHSAGVIQEGAAGGFANISLFDGNKAALARSVAIPALLRSSASADPTVVLWSLTALANVAELVDGRSQAYLVEAGAIERAVELSQVEHVGINRQLMRLLALLCCNLHHHGAIERREAHDVIRRYVRHPDLHCRCYAALAVAGLAINPLSEVVMEHQLLVDLVDIIRDGGVDGGRAVAFACNCVAAVPSRGRALQEVGMAFPLLELCHAADPATRGQAMIGLRHLALHAPLRNDIIAGGGLGIVAASLEDTTMPSEVHAEALALAFNLSLSESVKAQIAHSTLARIILTHLMSADATVASQAAATLASVTEVSESHAALAHAGAIILASSHLTTQLHADDVFFQRELHRALANMTASVDVLPDVLTSNYLQVVTSTVVPVAAVTAALALADAAHGGHGGHGGRPQETKEEAKQAELHADPVIARLQAMAFANIAAAPAGALFVVESGRVDSLMEQALGAPDLYVRRYALLALCNTAATPDTHAALMAIPDVCYHIIALMGEEDVLLRNGAVSLAANLAGGEWGRDALLAVDIVPHAISLLAPNDVDCRRAAAALLRGCATCDEGCMAMVHSGALPALLKHVQDDDIRLQREILAAVCNLSISKAYVDHTAEFASAARLDDFVLFLASSDAVYRVFSSLAVGHIAGDRDLSHKVMSYGVLAPLVANAAAADVEQRRAIAYALVNLVAWPENRSAVVSGGGTLPILELALSQDPEDQLVAFRALRAIAAEPQYRAALLANDALDFLANVIERECAAELTRDLAADDTRPQHVQVARAAAEVLYCLTGCEAVKLRAAEQRYHTALLLLLQHPVALVAALGAAALANVCENEGSRLSLHHEQFVPALLPLLDHWLATLPSLTGEHNAEAVRCIREMLRAGACFQVDAPGAAAACEACSLDLLLSVLRRALLVRDASTRSFARQFAGLCCASSATMALQLVPALAPLVVATAGDAGDDGLLSLGRFAVAAAASMHLPAGKGKANAPKQLTAGAAALAVGLAMVLPSHAHAAALLRLGLSVTPTAAAAAAAASGSGAGPGLDATLAAIAGDANAVLAVLQGGAALGASSAPLLHVMPPAGILPSSPSMIAAAAAASATTGRRACRAAPTVAPDASWAWLQAALLQDSSEEAFTYACWAASALVTAAAVHAKQGQLVVPPEFTRALVVAVSQHAWSKAFDKSSMPSLSAALSAVFGSLAGLAPPYVAVDTELNETMRSLEPFLRHDAAGANVDIAAFYRAIARYPSLATSAVGYKHLATVGPTLLLDHPAAGILHLTAVRSMLGSNPPTARTAAELLLPLLLVRAGGSSSSGSSTLPYRAAVLQVLCGLAEVTPYKGLLVKAASFPSLARTVSTAFPLRLDHDDIVSAVAQYTSDVAASVAPYVEAVRSQPHVGRALAAALFTGSSAAAAHAGRAAAAITAAAFRHVDSSDHAVGPLMLAALCGGILSNEARSFATSCGALCNTLLHSAAGAAATAMGFASLLPRAHNAPVALSRAAAARSLALLLRYGVPTGRIATDAVSLAVAEPGPHPSREQPLLLTAAMASPGLQRLLALQLSSSSSRTLRLLSSPSLLLPEGATVWLTLSRAPPVAALLAASVAASDRVAGRPGSSLLRVFTPELLSSLPVHAAEGLVLGLASFACSHPRLAAPLLRAAAAACAQPLPAVAGEAAVAAAGVLQDAGWAEAALASSLEPLLERWRLGSSYLQHLLSFAAANPRLRAASASLKLIHNLLGGVVVAQPPPRADALMAVANLCQEAPYQVQMVVHGILTVLNRMVDQAVKDSNATSSSEGADGGAGAGAGAMSGSGIVSTSGSGSGSGSGDAERLARGVEGQDATRALLANLLAHTDNCRSPLAEDLLVALSSPATAAARVFPFLLTCNTVRRGARSKTAGVRTFTPEFVCSQADGKLNQAVLASFALAGFAYAGADLSNTGNNASVEAFMADCAWSPNLVIQTGAATAAKRLFDRQDDAADGMKRRFLVSPKFMAALLQLSVSSDVDTAKNAAGAVANLTEDTHLHPLLAKAHAGEFFCTLIHHTDAEIVRQATRGISNMLETSHEHPTVIAQGLPGLAALSLTSPDPSILAFVVSAYRTLAQVPDAHDPLCHSGTVSALMRLAVFSDPRVQTAAAEALYCMSAHPHTASFLAECSGLLDLLVRLLHSCPRPVLPPVLGVLKFTSYHRFIAARMLQMGIAPRVAALLREFLPETAAAHAAQVSAGKKAAPLPAPEPMLLRELLGMLAMWSRHGDEVAVALLDQRVPQRIAAIGPQLNEDEAAWAAIFGCHIVAQGEAGRVYDQEFAPLTLQLANSVDDWTARGTALLLVRLLSAILNRRKVAAATPLVAAMTPLLKSHSVHLQRAAAAGVAAAGSMEPLGSAMLQPAVLSALLAAALHGDAEARFSSMHATASLAAYYVAHKPLLDAGALPVLESVVSSIRDDPPSEAYLQPTLLETASAYAALGTDTESQVEMLHARVVESLSILRKVGDYGVRAAAGLALANMSSGRTALVYSALGVNAVALRTLDMLARHVDPLIRYHTMLAAAGALLAVSCMAPGGVAGGGTGGGEAVAVDEAQRTATVTSIASFLEPVLTSWSITMNNDDLRPYVLTIAMLLTAFQSAPEEVVPEWLLHAAGRALPAVTNAESDLAVAALHALGVLADLKAATASSITQSAWPAVTTAYRGAKGVLAVTRAVGYFVAGMVRNGHLLQVLEAPGPTLSILLDLLRSRDGECIDAAAYVCATMAKEAAATADEFSGGSTRTSGKAGSAEGESSTSGSDMVSGVPLPIHKAHHLFRLSSTGQAILKELAALTASTPPHPAAAFTILQLARDVSMHKDLAAADAIRSLQKFNRQANGGAFAANVHEEVASASALGKVAASRYDAHLNQTKKRNPLLSS